LPQTCTVLESGLSKTCEALTRKNFMPAFAENKVV